MAQKKEKKSTASQKKAVKEFQRENTTDFQKGGGSDFQPRDANAGKEKAGASRNRRASNNHAKKEYGETFGQNVQKSGAGMEQEEKAEFTKAENTFSGQDDSNQPEETGKRQKESEDYHRRDTYRQSQKKGKYYNGSIRTGRKPKIPFLRKMRERSLRRKKLRNLQEVRN